LCSWFSYIANCCMFTGKLRSFLKIPVRLWTLKLLSIPSGAETRDVLRWSSFFQN
jgi:hypothetical protein